MTVRVSDPDNYATPLVEQMLEITGMMALQAWGEKIILDFDSVDILVADDVTPTAFWSEFTDTVVVNAKYFSALGDPSYLVLHELGHRIYGYGFAEHVERIAGALYFTGPNAMAEYGGPVPVTNDGQKAHISWGSGDRLKDDVMSGVHHDTSGPQVLSDLDIAIAVDCGWTMTDRYYVEHIYKLFLNRDPDQAGWDYWTDALASGQVARHQFVIAFADGAQGEDVEVVGVAPLRVAESFIDGGAQ